MALVNKQRNGCKDVFHALIIPGCQPTKSAVQLSLTTLQPI